LKKAYLWSRDNLVSFIAIIKSIVRADNPEKIREMLNGLRQDTEKYDHQFIQDKLKALSEMKIEKGIISDALMANRYYCNSLRFILDGLSELLLEVWAEEEDAEV
jgi:hypothetical protein